MSGHLRLARLIAELVDEHGTDNGRLEMFTRGGCQPGTDATSFEVVVAGSPPVSYYVTVALARRRDEPLVYTDADRSYDINAIEKDWGSS